MIKIEKENIDYEFEYLEHMLHHDNLESVLTNGLLSHNQVYQQKLIKQDISMNDVQQRRHRKNIKIEGINYNVHDFVSFYFNSRNPMLYKRRNIQDDLIIILINADILKGKLTDNQFAIFSDGNVASPKSRFFANIPNLINLDLKLLKGSSWNSENEEIKLANRRKMCSEVLVYPEINVCQIKKLICRNQRMYDFTTNLINKPNLKNNTSHIQVEIQQNYFF